ncbi:hypothetical protein K4L06_13270 [Lysobacter sp. BMK333-48F3]|uniref:hypothetical protein n=1 Tax=Lysobacter sp. BMK333-48F3 TaxID=2867962 RepID=UPI001C8B65F3|nr:hypothetical protein [Lysobacter sp. BMK333-48F3]MBX9402279.1 hypothetical protein [Lysobacter sp. BMK333-48F3]
MQRVDSVGLAELWNSDGPHLFTSKDGLIVGFWLADRESAPAQNGKTLVGFFAVGTGDVGEILVAVKVWLNGCDFSSETTKKFIERNGQVVLFFLPSGCASADLCAETIVALSIRLGEGGASVLVNGKPVGVIEGP